MTSSRRATCEYCGQVFTGAGHGPLPRYCSPSHRQRAYEQRLRQPRPVDAGGLLAGLRETSSEASADEKRYWALAKDVQRFLGDLGVDFKPVRPPRPKRPPRAQPSRARNTKPFVALLHERGTDPAALDAAVFTAHATESAAERAKKRYETVWRKSQPSGVLKQWNWAIRYAPDWNEAGASPAQVEEALAFAHRLTVHVNDADDRAVYKRSPHPDQPQVARVFRRQGRLQENLAVRRGMRPDAYRIDEGLGSHPEHDYAWDMLADACGLAYETNASRTSVFEELRAFRDDFLGDRSDTWELPAREIRAWLADRGAIRLVT